MLVFIHGFGGTPDELSPFRRSLAREMQIFSPTLLGHADRPFHSGGFQPIVEDLVEQLDRQGVWPAYLFGYSFGGYLALYLAWLFPERVSGVISLGGRIIRNDETLKFTRYVFSEERISHFSPEKRATMEANYGGAVLMQLHMARARALFDQMHSEPPLDMAALQSIRVPVLLMSGDADPFSPLADMKQAARMIPNTRILSFPGTTHPLSSAPLAALNPVICQFLREATASKDGIPAPPLPN